MMIGLAEVKSMIGDRVISDEDIKDSLWHYHFDSDRTSKYLIEKYDKANKPKKQPSKPAPSTGNKGMNDNSSSSSQDSVTKARSDTGGMSKLASLAAARKQRKASPEQQETNDNNKQPSKLAALANSKRNSKEGSSNTNLKSVHLLGRLSTPDGADNNDSAQAQSDSTGGSNALKKLALSRQRQNQNESSRPISPPKPTEEKKSPVPAKPEPAVKKFPQIDFNIYNEPQMPQIRGNPSSFGALFSEYDDNAFYNSNVSRVANTIYLPIDASSKAKEAFKGPSPDDVILNAQEKGGFVTNTNKSSGVDKEMGDLSLAGSAAATKPSVAAPKTKNVRKLDVDQELSKSKNSKPTINFVVIGHVDAGKSTLMGRLLYDSGAVDPKTIKKYEEESKLKGKGSFALAWVLDQTEEERNRGVTMDICVSSFETTNAKFTIVDAPGHKDFIPNMIAGSAQADYAVLVVDSATDAFESGFSLDGQTKEHAVLVRSLGVDSIVVAVNKLDTVNWSQERFDDIRIQLTEFLKKVGFKEQQVSFIPTSGLHGDNVTKRSSSKGLSWYEGDTLLAKLETINNQAERKDHKKNLRIITSDVVKGANTSDVSIVGRVDSGSIQVGEKVYISPSGKISPVKSLTTNNEQRSNWAVAGDNVTVNLGELENDDAIVGDVVCNLEAPIPSAKRFTCRIVVFELKRPITIGTKFIIHRGRINAPAKVSKILATLDKSNGQVIKQKPRHLTSNATAMVEVLLEDRPIPLETFKNSKELGRVVLRKDGATAAAGVVDELIE